MAFLPLWSKPSNLLPAPLFPSFSPGSWIFPSGRTPSCPGEKLCSRLLLVSAFPGPAQKSSPSCRHPGSHLLPPWCRPQGSMCPPSLWPSPGPAVGLAQQCPWVMAPSSLEEEQGVIRIKLSGQPLPPLWPLLGKVWGWAAVPAALEADAIMSGCGWGCPVGWGLALSLGLGGSKGWSLSASCFSLPWCTPGPDFPLAPRAPGLPDGLLEGGRWHGSAANGLSPEALPLGWGLGSKDGGKHSAQRQGICTSGVATVLTLIPGGQVN